MLDDELEQREKCELVSCIQRVEQFITSFEFLQQTHHNNRLILSKLIQCLVKGFLVAEFREQRTKCLHVGFSLLRGIYLIPSLIDLLKQVSINKISIISRI